MNLLRNQSLEIKTGLRKSFESADSKVANRVYYGYIKLHNGEHLPSMKLKPKLYSSYLIAIIMVIV